MHAVFKVLFKIKYKKSESTLKSRNEYSGTKQALVQN